MGPAEQHIAIAKTSEQLAAFHRLGLMFRSLRHRDFALFWGGNFLSNIGTWMQNVALGWLILVMTGSPFLLGVNGFMGSIPSLFFSLPGGAIADRLNRRQLLIYTQTSMMVLALSLAILTHTRWINIQAIFLISFLTGFAAALNHPVYQSMVPDLVDREDLLNAVALNSAQFNMSRALGPTLAGLTLGAVGAVGCFYLNSLSFLPLIIALGVITTRRQPAANGASVWRSMLDGLTYVRCHRLYLVLLSVPATLALLVLPFVVLMPVIARDMVGVGAAGLGYLMGGAGVGAVIAALTLAALAEVEQRVRLILVAAAAFSSSLILLSFVHSFWGAFSLLVIAGFTMVGTLALTNSSLQLLSPPEFRGRIMSMYTLSIMGMAPVGNLLAGAAAQTFGIRSMLILAGSLGLVYFVNLLVFLPRVVGEDLRAHFTGT
jgi:MFS family permease